MITGMNILIADDHKMFADGLATLLNKKTKDINDIYIASNATEAFKHFEDSEIGVAFIDIEFGKDDGREIATQLFNYYPSCKYIALSSHSEPRIITSSLKGAFSGYILKTDSLDTILKCIDSVASGEKFISPDSGVSLLNDLKNTSSKGLVPRLTKREREVLDCIAQEMNTKQIATHLYISEKTVEVHRSNLMLKMDVKNVAGLIRRAFETGLLN